MAGPTWNCCRLSTFCTPYTTMHHATSCKTTYMFSCNMLWLRSFTATAVTQGGTDTKIRVSTESWPWRRKFFHHSCRGFEPATFQSWIQHSSHWAIPSPHVPCIYLHEGESYAGKLGLGVVCSCQVFQLPLFLDFVSEALLLLLLSPLFFLFFFFIEIAPTLQIPLVEGKC